MDTSIIQLSPASQEFVDQRATTLGPWVIGGTLDNVLMGVVLCQVNHFFHNRQQEKDRMQRYETSLVILATLLSVLKSTQAVAIVWKQNVMGFADPDDARLLANSAWWQVSAPLMTGITGFVVQSFFAYRFLKLTGKWWFTLLVTATMSLGIIGICISTFYIVRNETDQKVTWLLIHLVAVCVSDILITAGTVAALYHRSSGLSSTTSLIKRLLRLIFQAAVPPAFVATIDLILTQTLGSKLLWHLVFNYSLEKLYVISLLYTLNSIGDHRFEHGSGGQLYNASTWRMNRASDVEMRTHAKDNNGGFGQVHISTQVTTHLSARKHLSISSSKPLKADPVDGIFDDRDSIDIPEVSSI